MDIEVCKNVVINSCGVGYCPECSTSLFQVKELTNYCRKCGQKVKWDNKTRNNIKVVDRHIIKKLVYEDNIDMKVCPICNNLPFLDDTQGYCNYCGQKIST